MQNPPILLFVDLDDTLFQTRHKNPLAEVPATQAARADNASYMSAAQQAFFELFRQSPQAAVVPVSARDLRQYRNTFLHGLPEIRSVVLYFGGMVLENGVEDPLWRERVQTARAGLRVPLQDLLEQARRVLGQEAGFTLYDVDGYYLTVKAARDCPANAREAVFAALAALRPADYLLHRNGRALSLYPQAIDKAHAVQYLLDKYRPALSLGAGDSLSDLPFMQRCDFRVVPRGSQIEHSFWRSDAPDTHR